MLDILLANWEPIAATSIAIISLGVGLRSYELRKKKEESLKNEKSKQLAIEISELKKDRESDSKRIDKLSELCKDQLSNTTEAKVMAAEAKQVTSTIMKFIISKKSN